MPMSLALGTVTSLMTRTLYLILNMSVSWYQEVSPTQEALQEVKFWFTKFVKFDGQRIWPKPSAVKVVYSDASCTRCDGYIMELGHLVASGMWSNDKAKDSSIWHELRAVRMVLRSFQQ